MKLSELTFLRLIEKGPIIGAPKGSQKDARMGTDDPAKYMRGGEWEAYREPQGVNSDAGKIASGRKKGTTRTKNKKMSESEQSLYEILHAGTAFWFNPYTDQVVSEYMWTDPGSSHSQAATTDLGIPELEGRQKQGTDDYEILGIAMEHGWIRGIQVEGRIVLQGGTQQHAMDAYEAIAPFIQKVTNDMGEITQAVEVGSLDGFDHTFIVEGNVLPAGGPGASGDLVPRDHHATTVAVFKDTTKHNRKKGEKMPGSDAPVKQVKANIKKSHDNRPGNVSDINEQVEKIVNESVPKVMHNPYDADYDLRDDKDQETIGVAKIEGGVITVLSVRNDLAEDFEGHIMSRLLGTIIRDADLANANLAIQLDDPSDQQHKRFMERFGFRETGNGIMKRNAGSVTPPSVPTTRL